MRSGIWTSMIITELIVLCGYNPLISRIDADHTYSRALAALVHLRGVDHDSELS